MRNSDSQRSARATAQTTRWQVVRAAIERHQGSPYAAFREALRALLPYGWRRRAVHFVRRRFGLLSLRDWLQAQWRLSAPAIPENTKSLPGDFYGAMQLLPHLSKPAVKAILDRPVSTLPQRRLDVICFSIIDWSFRFQRPQQVMTQFASAGHRVFYINISNFLSPYAHPKFSLAPLQPPSAQENCNSGNNLYDLRISTRYPLDLFGGIIEGKDAEAVLESLDELRLVHYINDAIGYVMIPSWGNVALAAQSRWGWHIIYDCMDEWENFPHVNLEALTLEKRMVQSCDLLVVTAERLLKKWDSHGRSGILARNAADYTFYANRCLPNELLSDIKHPIIGYFGAIADWFDIELLAEAARQRPEYSFVILGGIFDIDVSPLQRLPNVKLLGQQPYETMPRYLYHFDACMIPFRINSITEATDPVKLYEYLCGGKPVVAIRLPELEPYRDFIYLAENTAEFIFQLDKALLEDSLEKSGQRRALAQQHTWKDRYQQIIEGLSASATRTSIVIVTYNNLALTKLCIESVLRNTQHLNYEVIIVDNNSRDGTPAYLEEMTRRQVNLKIILNSQNFGFARANNQGIQLSTGERLVLLNNDTVVPPGWLSRLLWHLRDPQIGLVGPVTNFAGNEAKIDVTYESWIEMEEFAYAFTRERQGQIADIHMLAMFCVVMRRDVYNRIGPLDEQFGIGMFEDDDYSARVRQAGLRLVCAADSFVHHFGQAAFGKLIERGTYNSLFDENRKKYEAKWHTVWQPHQHAELKFELHVMKN